MSESEMHAVAVILAALKPFTLDRRLVVLGRACAAFIEVSDVACPCDGKVYGCPRCSYVNRARSKEGE